MVRHIGAQRASENTNGRHDADADDGANGKVGAKQRMKTGAARPPALPVLADGIPSGLKKLDRWLVWKWVRQRAEWSKVPFRGDNPSRPASSTDQATWASFDAALAAYQRGGPDGVGFVLAEGDGLCCVDLDDCRDPATERLSELADEVIAGLGSYAEVSPTGTGVKVYLRAGKRPGTKCAFDGGVEVYARARYLCVTGHRLDWCPAEPLEQQSALDLLLARLAPPAEAPEVETFSEQFARAPHRDSRGGQRTAEERAALYLERCPEAVAGQRGHATLFAVARAVVYGFDLGVDAGLRLLASNYNGRCKPPWTDKELLHKCRQADAAPYSKPRGYLLHAERPPASSTPRGDPPPAGPEPKPPASVEAGDDPHRLARLYLDDHTRARVVALRWWREQWLRWDAGAYRPLLDKELRADLGRRVKMEFDRLNAIEVAEWRAAARKGSPPTARKVTARLTGDVAHALAGLVRVDGQTDQPSWLDGAGPAPAAEVLVCRNGVVHLPSWAGGRDCLSPLTPRLFTANALPYDFDPRAAEPAEWLRFLGQVWPDDLEAVQTLQEWLGYLLLPDTSQQKICMLVGPRRCGKGTIARVLTQLVGPGNVCSPTLAALGLNFGLQPLLGKTVAIIADARLSGRTDAAVVTERLLSISGEDGQTVDRKHMTAVTSRLPVRFAILTNELPRLSDASGALVGRLVVLRMTRSWYGNEDAALTGKLLGELPGILLWAMKGWARLRVRGHFVQPKTSAKLIEAMEDLASPVGAFLRECCEVGPGFRVLVADLYQRWRAWCETKGRQPTSEQVLGRDLRAAAPGVEVSQPRIGGVQVRRYDGIRIRKVGEDEPPVSAF